MAFVTLCGRSSVYCIYTQTFHKVFSISRGYWTNYWLTTIYLQPYFDIILVVYVVYSFSSIWPGGYRIINCFFLLSNMCMWMLVLNMDTVSVCVSKLCNLVSHSFSILGLCDVRERGKIFLKWSSQEGQPIRIKALTSLWLQGKGTKTICLWQLMDCRV